MSKLAVLTALVLSLVWSASGQVALVDVKSIEGPWECNSPSGIKGIFVTVETALLNTSDIPTINWQTVSLRVYHRSAGKAEEAQYCEAPPYERFDQPHEKNYTTDLRDGHLVIHYDIDLDLRFDPDAKHWAGTWAEPGQKQDVVILERPHPLSGARQNPLVGDWVSNPDLHARPIPSPGSLHIRESSDGILTAWLDRELSGFNPRTKATHVELWSGERLEILADQTKLTLATTGPIGAVYHYSGTLSSDRKNLVGAWQAQESGRLSAPANFIRMQQ